MNTEATNNGTNDFWAGVDASHSKPFVMGNVRDKRNIREAYPSQPSVTPRKMAKKSVASPAVTGFLFFAELHSTSSSGSSLRNGEG